MEEIRLILDWSRGSRRAEVNQLRVGVLFCEESMNRIGLILDYERGRKEDKNSLFYFLGWELE